MPAALTRRSDPDAQHETWLIHYGDVQVGAIGIRSGVPIGTDQWGWRIGFHPASARGQRASGTAKSFDVACAAFDTAWQFLHPKFTEADFTGYRQHRAFDAWKHAMWDAGCKLPTQVADGRSTCFCRVEITIADRAARLRGAYATARRLRDHMMTGPSGRILDATVLIGTRILSRKQEHRRSAH